MIMGELEFMINNSKIDLSQFFTMHPFSATEKSVYDSALKNIDFYDTLYVKTFKTFERLSVICNVINNTAKNLIVVTGYRGCGKTNFLHLIKHIFDGYKLDETISNVYKNELDKANNIEDLKEAIAHKYNDSIKRINSSLFFAEEIGDVDGSIFNEALNMYIEKHLSGCCKYINFDEGGMGRNKPFSTKLFFMLRNSVEEQIKSGTFEKIIEKIKDFVIRNKWIIAENFENIDYRKLEQFWNNVYKKSKTLEPDSFYEFLFEELKKLDLSQLLFAYTIWEYSEISINNPNTSERRLLYLLDNIDMISDGNTNIFQNTIMGIWQFIWDSRNVFSKIKEKENKDDLDFCEIYSNTKIIVAMRETTAMHISGHLRDKMRSLMEHFDMSTDIDKTMIMQKKIDFCIEKIDDGKIINKKFIAAVQCLNKLISDRLLMRNLFLLYNNDYRTSMLSLITICIEHFNEVDFAVKLIESDNPNKIYGGRGIIYRLIFDAFFDWSYFDAIGISSSRPNSRALSLQSQYGYSCSRILLTILCNKQSKNSERFFVNPEESVKLANLYDMVKDFMSIEDFVNIIDGMYSLRNKKYWNHLVTFDNIWTYSPDIIKNYIENDEKNQTKETEVYIRATSAGQFFASNICTHYEYFSSRFIAEQKNTPLFLLKDMNNKKEFDEMKQILDTVYYGVEKCCKTLNYYNQKVLKKLDKKHYNHILCTPYYYETQFHEERIIHSHISYLESYRNFLINSSSNETTATEASKYIIFIIRKYLNLLKYNPENGLKTYRNLFLSNNSKNLFNQLCVCIEKIESNPKMYKDIEITRQYYNTNFDGEQCKFFKENEIK